VDFDIVKSLPGSIEPKDIFEPHMPGVDVLSNMDALFARAREMIAEEELDSFAQNALVNRLIKTEDLATKTPKGQRHVAIVTPGRMILLVPGPLPNSKSEKDLAPMKEILRSEKPLQISAISFTKLESYMQDKTKTKCIPFLGFLLAFAYLGHSVVVFEGHPSALESGVRHSDALFIDSGMLPFLQEDWAAVCFRAMNPDPRVFMHERKNFELKPIAKKGSPPGWQYTEPDGEKSYINILLSTIAKAKDSTRTISIIVGQPLPNPKDLINDPKELEYISILPFKYDRLNSLFVLKLLWAYAKPAAPGTPENIRIFKAKLAQSDRTVKDVAFQFMMTKAANGRDRLDIQLLGSGA
jgi:hypothetical protein